MKNQLLTIFTLLIIGFSYNAKTQAQSYCENGAYSAHYFWIESVASNDFYHSAGPLQGFLDDQDHLYHGYLDYTDLTLNWQEGVNPITLTSGISFPGYEMYWQVWVDLNADFEFSEDELLLSTPSMDVVNESIDLSGLGLFNDLTTRMRVSMSFLYPAPVCGPFSLGEVEDYQVVISLPDQNTLQVPAQYPTIQAAVDSALPGDRVLVSDGEYNEQITIDKPLDLASSNGPNATTITTDAFKHPIKVTSPNVSISGFNLKTTVRNSKAAILFDQGANDGKVSNVRCQANGEDAFWYMIQINMANGIEIDGAKCNAGGINAIYALDANDLNISDIEVSGHTGSGVALIRVENAEITNSHIHHNSYGIDIGSSQNVAIRDNMISHNQHNSLDPLQYGHGIGIVSSSEIYIENNLLDNNSNAGIKINFSDTINVSSNISTNSLSSGINISYSNDLMIMNNQLQDNGQYGIYLFRSENNHFKFNEVVDNNQSMVVFESDGNKLINNFFIENSSAQNPCPLTFGYQSSNNHIYLNTFRYAPIYDFCGNINSTNLWHSLDVFEYSFQNQTFNGQLGNYYESGNHTDSDNNGIADEAYIIYQFGNVTDAFPLTNETSEYSIE